MPPRIVRSPRSGPVCGVVFAGVVIWSASPLAGQDLLPLQRDYPGSGPYECPATTPVSAPSPEDGTRANQLASEANEAMVLGDLERVQILLEQSVALNGSSADLAYRHARVLEQLGDVESALVEFCRAIDLNVAAIGVFDAQDRIDTLADAIRRRIPEAAHQAFRRGLVQADDSLYVEAIEAFTAARDAAPEWTPPLYNRAVIYERLGMIQQALEDFRAYLDADPVARDALVVRISERIGVLEGAASVVPPSPTGALAFGLIPGMGHFYTGRPVGGAVTLASSTLAIVAGMLVRDITTLCLEPVDAGAMCPQELIVDEITERPYMWHGIGVAAAITVAGAVDALIKAKRRRAEAEAIVGAEETRGVSIGFPSVSASGSSVDLNLLSLRFR